jgi:hypothetical protein
VSKLPRFGRSRHHLNPEVCLRSTSIRRHKEGDSSIFTALSLHSSPHHHTHTMSYTYRSPQKGYSKAYRSSPYGSSASKSKPGPTTFQPSAETLEDAGSHLSPNIKLARTDPPHHYLLRSGLFCSKPLASVCVEKPAYVQWMKTKHYDALPTDHILRKALDQCADEQDAKKTSGPYRFPRRHPGSEKMMGTVTCICKSVSSKFGTRHPMHCWLLE